jgi:hypothetical protein
VERRLTPADAAVVLLPAVRAVLVAERQEERRGHLPLFGLHQQQELVVQRVLGAEFGDGLEQRHPLGRIRRYPGQPGIEIGFDRVEELGTLLFGLLLTGHDVGPSLPRQVAAGRLGPRPQPARRHMDGAEARTIRAG